MTDIATLTEDNNRTNRIFEGYEMIDLEGDRPAHLSPAFWQHLQRVRRDRYCWIDLREKVQSDDT